MGRISSVFKADGEETAKGYSISEWWLEPHTKGPGAHAHPEDDGISAYLRQLVRWTRGCACPKLCTHP